MVSPSLNLKVSFCISFCAAACDILDNLIRREGDEMDRTLEPVVNLWQSCQVHGF